MRARIGRSFGLSLGLLLLLEVAHAAEMPLAPLAGGAAVASQYPDSGASDGNDYLFVWTDAPNNHRRATRVTRDGVVLDRAGIDLPYVWSRNSVVWTGNSYLVVWGIGYPSAVWGLRIDRDGKVIDGPRILRDEAYPTSVISNGSEVVIAYHGHSPPYGELSRRAMFLNADANPVANPVTDIALDAPATSGGSTSLAWNGTHFAAVWVHSVLDDPKYSVKALRFNAAGKLDAAPRTLLEGSSTHYVPTPAIASDGDDFVMVTSDPDNMQYAHRISADLGTVGPPQPLPRLNYELSPPVNYSSPIVWTGSSYVLFGHDGDAITAVRLDRQGWPVDAQVIESSAGTGSFVFPVAATNGRDFLVAWTGRSWSDPQETETDVFATLVSASTLDRRSRTLLSIDTQQQGRPLIASGETNLLAVWREGSSLFARRLAPDGSPLDAAPVRLAERGTPASIVFNGTDYIVIWQQSNGQPYSQDLLTARVPRHGPLRVDGGARMPNAQLRAAAGNGTVTVLLWDSGEGLGEGLNASRLSGDGTFLDTVPLMLETAEGIGRVALAASDGDFLVVWEDHGPEPYFHYPPAQSVKVRGSRLSPDLVLRDGGGFVISAATPFESEPAVTWNEEKWLVIWCSNGGWSPDQIRGRLVARDGTLDDEPAGAVIVNGGRKPSVTWDGTRYFITWQISHAWGLPLLPDTLRAAWFPNLGSPVVSEKSLALGYLDVSVAAIGPGRVATAYARKVADAAFGDVSQAFLNLVTHLPRRHAAR